MTRNKHPNKEIELAIQYAEQSGWRYQSVGRSAHAWGRLACPLSTREGCYMYVYSTPRNPINHARQIIRNINKCAHLVKIMEASV